MNRNHENSSKQSSKENFPKKIKNSIVKSSKKPCAQYGHIGHKRSNMSPNKPDITIPIPSDIIYNPDYYLTSKTLTKQVCDIEVRVSVTEYTTPEYRSRFTDNREHAPFPNGVIN